MTGAPGKTGPSRRRAPDPDPAELSPALDAAAACYAAGRLEEAARLYRQVESRHPADVRARYSLAVIDLRLGRFDEARRRLQGVVRRQPDLHGAWHNLGVALQAVGRWEKAADAYGRALALRPDAGETRSSLAVALAVLGRADEAVQAYRVLANDPARRLAALTRLAILRPAAITDPELADLQASAADGTLDPEARVGALFATGETLDARGAADLAFQAYAAGNRLKHQTFAAGAPATRPQAVEQDHAHALRRIEALFTPDFLAGHAERGDRTTAPIFVVGWPRSGSSLAEQILSSHPKVQGMGEGPALSSVLDGRFPYAPDTPPEPDHFRALARAYLEAQRARGWTERPRLADKTLENHLHVGMIHLMFPRAVILHMVRDPTDTCLACYRQLFASGNETLYDLGQIGAEYVRYRRLMDHWNAVLPGRVTEVDYEALVTDPERRIRWLVTEACGLSWAPECLDFHQTRRTVATASAAQVRQPIFRTSLARWRPYAAYLGPLFEALGPYAPPEFRS